MPLSQIHEDKEAKRIRDNYTLETNAVRTRDSLVPDS